MKKIIGLVMLLLFAFVLVGCGETTTVVTTLEPTTTQTTTPTTVITTANPLDLGVEDVYNYTFSQLDENVMPIGAWADPPPPNFAGIYDNPDLVNNAQYELISQSGINVMYGLYNNVALNFDYVIKSLEYAEDNDVVYVVRDSQVVGLYDSEDYVYLKRALDKYKDYPAFGGVMVQDEPGILSFDNLGSLYDGFREYLPNDTFYVNLLPTYANNNQLINGAGGGTLNDDDFTYEEYIDQYLEKIDTEYLSYDFYPFVGLEYSVMREGYFNQMSIVREKTSEAEIPFWVFIQSCSWAKDGLRVPNKAEVFWQISTALAYGSKGIQYFTYYTPMEADGNFVGGMVDSNGNINPMYYIVQEANEHIAFIDDILMNSVSKGVIVHGDTPDAIPESDQLESFSVLETVIGNDALIGCFNYQGRPALYVVNNSFDLQNASISLRLSQSVSYSTYQGVELTESTGDTIDLSIPTGEGVLIVLND